MKTISASSTGMATASNKGSNYFHQKENSNSYLSKSWEREEGELTHKKKT